MDTVSRQYLNGETNDTTGDLGAYDYHEEPILVRAYGDGEVLNAIYTKPISLDEETSFSLTGGIGVSDAVVDETGYRIVLTLDGPLAEETEYTLTVVGIIDSDQPDARFDGSVAFTPDWILINENFDDNEIPEWTIWDDPEADINAPSNWAVADGVLYQRSNISDEDTDISAGFGTVAFPNPESRYEKRLVGISTEKAPLLVGVEGCGMCRYRKCD